MSNKANQRSLKPNGKGDPSESSSKEYNEDASKEYNEDASNEYNEDDEKEYNEDDINDLKRELKERYYEECKEANKPRKKIPKLINDNVKVHDQNHSMEQDNATENNEDNIPDEVEQGQSDHTLNELLQLAFNRSNERKEDLRKEDVEIWTNLYNRATKREEDIEETVDLANKISEIANNEHNSNMFKIELFQSMLS